MTRPAVILCLVLGVASCLQAGPPESENGHKLQVYLSEVQPGALSTENYCMLVFADHRFHSEKAVRKLGKDQERIVYEGDLSDSDWNTLIGILDNEQFRRIHNAGIAPLVVEDAHAYNIAVARAKETQNLEFLDNASRKPYDAQLKPLFQWWKSVRGRHTAKSDAPPDSRCALDSSRTVFSY